MRSLHWSTVALSISLATAANAQSITLPIAQVPSSPAQEVLQAKPDVVLTPGTPAEIATDFSSIITTSGSLRPGTAIEISGRKLGLGDSSAYFTDYGARFLNRMSFSVATAAQDPTTSTADVGAALGARFVFWDMDDPLLDSAYTQCATAKVTSTCRDDAATKCAELFPVDSEKKLECVEQAAEAISSSGTTSYRACLVKSAGVETYAALQEKYASAWKGSSGVLGLAVSGNFPGGVITKARGGAFAVWFSGSVQLGEAGDLILTGTWRQRFGPQAGLDNASAGGRLRLGNAGLRGFLDAALGFTQSASGSVANVVGVRIPLVIGVEVRLGDTTGLWAHLGLGATIDPSHLDQIAGQLVSSLSWGLGPLPGSF
jgi:hypothetical protein